VRRKFKWNEKALVMFTGGDCYYTTNSEGQGLFFVDQVKNSRRQITGTCQFSIRGLKPQSAKNKMSRFVGRDEE